MFIGLLTGIVNASNNTKCISLSNQEYKIQPTFISLYPNGYSQKLHYYPFGVKLDKCVRSCNTLNDLSNKVCIPNKTEDSGLHAFNIITGTNESKILTKDISCQLNVNLVEENVIQIKSGITINVDASVKNIVYVKRLFSEPL